MRVPRGKSLWTARLDGDLTGGAQQGVLDELRRAILDGDAPPGTVIPLDDVAKVFGVSHIPVREALKTLAAEGLVTHRPHSGFAVAQLTLPELQEFYTVRGVLEQATLVAAVGLAGPNDDDEARAAHLALEHAVGEGDTRGHHRESRRFHFALLTPSRMDRMLHMLESAWNMTEPVQPMSHAGPVYAAQFNIDHQAMLDAFLARDAAALAEAARAHHDHLVALITSLDPATDRLLGG